jgi:acyl-CoA dehydrogenase
VDTKRPAESTLGMVVKAGTPGFTLGRHEDKMGQRVCPASVLEFDDCFIPDDQVLFDAHEVGRRVGRPAREVGQRYLDYVLSSTRSGVCAFGTGAARGALEAALAYAADTQVGGVPLIGREWVQSLLAEMQKNVALGRLAYQEANNVSGLRGLYQVLQSPAAFHTLRLLPKIWFDSVLPSIIDRPEAATLMAKLLYGGGDPADQRCCSGWASLAKVAGTDMGVRNAQLALELMGQAGLRQSRGVEKILRDAKLLQIYEGTNQLNRLNLFKCLLAPEAPGVKLFTEAPFTG